MGELGLQSSLGHARAEHRNHYATSRVYDPSKISSKVPSKLKQYVHFGITLFKNFVTGQSITVNYDVFTDRQFTKQISFTILYH